MRREARDERDDLTRVTETIKFYRRRGDHFNNSCSKSPVRAKYVLRHSNWNLPGRWQVIGDLLETFIFAAVDVEHLLFSMLIALSVSVYLSASVCLPGCLSVGLSCASLSVCLRQSSKQLFEEKVKGFCGTDLTTPSLLSLRQRSVGVLHKITCQTPSTLGSHRHTPSSSINIARTKLRCHHQNH